MTRSKLRPEERVRVAVDMVDLVTRISADSERERNPPITERTLILPLRRRFQLGRRRVLLSGDRCWRLFPGSLSGLFQHQERFNLNDSVVMVKMEPFKIMSWFL